MTYARRRGEGEPAGLAEAKGEDGVLPRPEVDRKSSCTDEHVAADEQVARRPVQRLSPASGQPGPELQEVVAGAHGTTRSSVDDGAGDSVDPWTKCGIELVEPTRLGHGVRVGER